MFLWCRGIGIAIVSIHRAIRSLSQPCLHRCVQPWHQTKNVFPLITRERGKHEISEIAVDVFALGARAHANAQSRIILVGKGGLYTAKSVVTTGAATRTD